ncbi:MAG: response regulator transcription factor [Elusimicrobia bacterium]|nr:response regulator transcription factor [Elusimicrobiota bacterium]
MRILIAEDDDNFRSLITEVVSQAGHEAAAEPNGRLAWERLLREGADMLITDINMPELDGFGLLRNVRGSDEYGKIPVLMLTIRELAEDQVAGYDTGADDYLTKPFANEVLLARIKVLERRIRRAAPRKDGPAA